jgi:hypothetical protein
MTGLAVLAARSRGAALFVRRRWSRARISVAGVLMPLPMSAAIRITAARGIKSGPLGVYHTGNKKRASRRSPSRSLQSLRLHMLWVSTLVCAALPSASREQYHKGSEPRGGREKRETRMLALGHTWVHAHEHTDTHRHTQTHTDTHTHTHTGNALSSLGRRRVLGLCELHEALAAARHGEHVDGLCA